MRTTFYSLFNVQRAQWASGAELFKDVPTLYDDAACAQRAKNALKGTVTRNTQWYRTYRGMSFEETYTEVAQVVIVKLEITLVEE